jgi:hypothetical protein
VISLKLFDGYLTEFHEMISPSQCQNLDAKPDEKQPLTIHGDGKIWGYL